MMVLVTYDVNVEIAEGKRRLRNVAKACKNYGQRVQNSVFECLVDPAKWVVFRQELIDIVKSETDKKSPIFPAHAGMNRMRGKIIFLITIPYRIHRLCRYAQFSNGKGALLNPTNLIITYSLPLLFLLSVSCQSTGTGKLTDAERHMCDSIGIDQALIAKLRSQGASPVEPFNDSIYGNEIEPRVDTIHLKGLVFKAMPDPCERILEQNHGIFRDNGYALFILERHFGIGNKPDIMAVLATIDKFKILGTIGTNGLNYDIDNDSIISVIRELDRKYSLDLIGAGGDWCEFVITKPPVDWADLAREAYAFCPDIVDQGTGTVDALEQELKRTKRLYFWWD